MTIRAPVPFVFTWLLVLLVGCAASDPGGLGDEPGSDDALFASEATVLRDLGHLGHGANGDPNIVDRFHVVDLEGDGHEELVITTTYAGLDQLEPSSFRVLALRNGSLADATDDLFPEGAPAAIVNRDLHFADMNGDGHQDLFLSNQGTEAITPFPGEQNRLYLSDGRGRWFDRTDTHLPPIVDFSHGSTIADIDGDGTTEIHVNNLGGGEDQGNYLLQQSEDGRYIATSEPVAGSDGGFFSAFVDVSGNGAPDLFVGPRYDSQTDEWSYGLLLNDGDGSFRSADPQTLPPVRDFRGHDPSAALPEAILVADLTGDGRDDILSFVRYGAFVGSFFTLLVNGDDGTLTDETDERLPEQDFAPIETSIPHLQLVDIDGDHDLDLLAGAFDFTADPDGGTFKTWHYRNDGSGNFLEALELPADLRPEAAVIDANGDGLLDLVSIHRDWRADGETYLSVHPGLSNP